MFDRHVINTVDIRKHYYLKEKEVVALNGITLGIEKGEFISVMGPSGSGKTTLMNMLGLLDRPDSGHILFEGRNVQAMGSKERAFIRGSRIGIIFQSFNLIPVLSAFENVDFPLRIQGGLGKRERTRLVMGALDQVGLRNFIDHKPDELSGGQMQRVAIARAIVTQPRVIIADEPTGNLDSMTGKAIVDLLKEINRHGENTVAISTHDPDVMAQTGRIIEIKDGIVTSDTCR